jgi:squalene cyclase
MPQVTASDARVGAERGAEFLLARQGPDRRWRDFQTLAGEAVDWPTAVIGAALADSERGQDALEHAADALIATQQPDGGWGYSATVPTDADSTACVIRFLAVIERRGDWRVRAVACLARHHSRDSGGVATYREPGPIRRFMGLPRHGDLSGWCSEHLEVTAAAGLAFAAVGARECAEAAWRYVKRRQRRDGSWASFWWVSPHYPTRQAADLAVALADKPSARRAAAWIARDQQPDGGWSGPGGETSAFATAESLSVLLGAGADAAGAERGVKRLLSLQQPDGGWLSEPIMRIPPPHTHEPDSVSSWRPDALGTGVVVRDQHRLFTTAACVRALALAGGATR